MDTKHLHVTVNLDALLGELQSALQFSINLVAMALKSTSSSVDEELRFPQGIFGTTFDQRLQWSPEEAVRHYHTWALSNGLRDAIEGVSSFLESAHRVLSAWALIECQNAGTRLKQSDWEAGMDGTAFHRLGLPDKLVHIQNEHHVVPDNDLQRHVLSVNSARNCLVHRRGVVSTRDVDAQGVLTVEWRKLHTFLQDDDGEHELVIGQRIEKESWVCIKVIDEKKAFSLGEQVKFSAQEFADITWGLFAFGSDLVQKMSAAGQSKGFVTPQTPVQQRAQADGPASGGSAA